MAGILVVLLFTAVASHAEPAPRDPASPEVYSPQDPVQKCLDDIRIKKYKTKLERQKKAEAEAKKFREQSKAGGGAPVSPYKFDLVNEDSLPQVCREGNMERFKVALRRQIENCAQAPRKDYAGPMRLGCKLVSREDYCMNANKLMLKLADKYRDNADFPKLMDEAGRDFDWYKSRGMLDDSLKLIPKGMFQFTGFYGPESIETRSHPDGDFKYPIYRAPDEGPDKLFDYQESHEKSCGKDPITKEKIEVCRMEKGKLVPYYTRREIDVDKKLDKKWAIAYAKDIVEIAFLMVQGDGMIIRDGQPVRLNFGHKNGHPSSLLGSIVNCTGGKAGGMESIGNYLKAHPEKMEEWMNYDRSYIFFSEGLGDAKGVENIQMVERHSLATDLKLIRTGSMLMFQMPRPTAKNAPPAKVCGPQLTSLGISQDTGGAILNTHADFFLGEGKLAAQYADSLNSPGTLLIGVPKGAGKAVKNCKP
jgi:membrane-bound lytic murein transglycosylase